MDRWLAIGLAASLCGVPAIAQAAPPLRADLKVDCNAIGTRGALLQERVAARVEANLRHAEVLPNRDTSGPAIELVVVPLPGDDVGYRTLYRVRSGEDLLHEGSVDCPTCTEDELVDQARRIVAAVVPKLPKPPEPAVETAPVPVAAKPTPTDRDHRRPLGAMGKAGLALGLVGAAGVGVGVALIVRKPVVIEDQPTEQRSTRRPGIGVAVGAGVVLVTGVALLIVDRVRAMKSQPKTRPKTRARVQGSPAALTVRF